MHMTLEHFRNQSQWWH